MNSYRNAQPTRNSEDEMSIDIQNVVNGLGRAFFEQGFVNCEDDRSQYPCKLKVEQITDQIVQGFFPGFFGAEMTRRADVFKEISGMVNLINKDFAHEIRKAINSRENHLNDLETDRKTNDLVVRFLSQLAPIRRIICDDIAAARDGDPAAHSEEEIILAYPYLPVVIAYRLAHVLYELDVPLIPRMMTEWGHTKSGLDIHPGARIGAGFFCDHATMTTIGETCVIEDHVRLYQGVGLIAKSLSLGKIPDLRDGKMRRHPTIKRGTTIYSNAVIIGPVTVGECCTIGANVVIEFDIPDHHLVSAQVPKDQLLVRRKPVPAETISEIPHTP